MYSPALHWCYLEYTPAFTDTDKTEVLNDYVDSIIDVEANTVIINFLLLFGG